jgi:multicomponent K+:H+ antiporter subunit D
MNGLAAHLMIAPIVLPLLAGAAMLFVGSDGQRIYRAGLNVVSTFALIGVAIALLARADGAPHGVAGVYRLGDWPAPFAIVLVVDRLSAFMVLLTGVIAAAAVVFSLARWHRVGPHFHSLFQFLLMGLNGAFLTGDLFNLFVFFEVLLVASYGLALHGAGPARIRAGMQYVVVNLTASFLFLVGVSLIYGVTGTLNMADIAVRVPQLEGTARILMQAGAAVLAVAFLVKAAMWPLCFWLPSTYAAASPPVACVFAILTKVGAYAVLRLWPVLFAPEIGSPGQFGGHWLLIGGLATIAFGTIGCLASQDMARLASFSVLVSSGTVLAAVGMGEASVTGRAIYYLASSTLGLAALFLLVELAERGREPGADMIALTRELYGAEEPPAGADEEIPIGIAIPVTMALLEIAFVCCALVVAGLPPLSGFIAKVGLLKSALNAGGSQDAVPLGSWALVAMLLLSGLAYIVALSRAGIRAFWAEPDRAQPRIGLIEFGPIAVLLFLCLAQTIAAGPVMRFAEATAQDLHAPQSYIRAVLGPAGHRGGS